MTRYSLPRSVKDAMLAKVQVHAPLPQRDVPTHMHRSVYSRTLHHVTTHDSPFNEFEDFSRLDQFPDVVPGGKVNATTFIRHFA